MSKQYDDFFKLIVEDECECPSNDGASYEIISAAVFSIIDKKSAIHDLHIAGITDYKHQIDALLNEEILVEAKDKVKGNNKVGIGVARELQTNLVDIDFSKEGYLVTNTEFSRDVVKFRDGIVKNKKFKPIHLYHIRTSNPNDLKGRITGFKIKTVYHSIVLINLKLKFKDHTSNSWVLDKLQENDLDYVVMNCFLDSNFQKINIAMAIKDSLPEDLLDVISTTLLPGEKRKLLFGTLKSDTYYVSYKGQTFELDSISYQYLYERMELFDEIKPNGEPCIYVSCKDKKINKLITDTDLKHAILKVVKDSKEYKELLKDK